MHDASEIKMPLTTVVRIEPNLFFVIWVTWKSIIKKKKKRREEMEVELEKASVWLQLYPTLPYQISIN